MKNVIVRTREYILCSNQFSRHSVAVRPSFGECARSWKGAATLAAWVQSEKCKKRRKCTAGDKSDCIGAGGVGKCAAATTYSAASVASSDQTATSHAYIAEANEKISPLILLQLTSKLPHHLDHKRESWPPSPLEITSLVSCG